MPSREHAMLVELFRASPTLAAILLRHAGLRPPGNVRPAIADSTLPASIADRHADLVVVLRPVRRKHPLAIVVEIQLAIDRRKPRRWLGYHIAAEERHRAPAVVLVVTPHARVARWAGKPIAIGPNGSFAPLVLGPDEVPRLTELREPSPELAVLSALAHRRDSGRAAMRVVARALTRAETGRASLYSDLLCATFGESFERAVEEQMNKGEPFSDWAKKHYRKGKAEGQAKGEARGEARGEAKGKAAALLAVLAARNLPISTDSRHAIQECSDATRLDRWIAHAVTVESVEALLSDT
jgi:hypothetical protein